MRNAWMGILGAVVVGLAGATAACGDASLDPGGMSHRSSGTGPGGAANNVDPTDPASSGDPGATPNSTSPIAIPAGAGVPCDIATMLAAKCQACHANPPIGGSLSAIVTIADLLAPSKEDPSKNVAEVSLSRMQNTASPMPPASFGNAATSAEVASFSAWVTGGYQGSCNSAPPPVQTGNLTCTSCHGDATRAAVAGADTNFLSAPPKGSKGETMTSQLAVGAHQAHVGRAALLANPIQCNECHVVPTTQNHSNGIDDVTFGTLAKTGGKNPAYTGGSCSATYCHGNFSGGTNATPSWTGGAQTCSSCHGAPPSTGHHKTSGHGVACSTCHGTGYNATASTVNKTLHIDGKVQAGGAGSSITYNAANGSCTPSGCHGTRTW